MPKRGMPKRRRRPQGGDFEKLQLQIERSRELRETKRDLIQRNHDLREALREALLELCALRERLNDRK